MENFVFSLFNINIGIGQDSALFPILLALYISLIFYIFEKRSKNLNILILFLSFVNDRFLTLQGKSFKKTKTFLFCSYNIILFLLKQFGLVIKHKKSKIFHFSKSHRIFNLSFLNLSLLRGPILCSKNIWRYLDFIFNRKLFFWQYINFYLNLNSVLSKRHTLVLSNTRKLNRVSTII